MLNQYCQKLIIILFLVVLLFGMAQAGKPLPRVIEIPGEIPVFKYPESAPVIMRTGDTCTVYNGGSPAWYIYPWVIGDELYKAYQDPSASCSQPYPFLVEFVYIPIVYLSTDTVFVSVDVELADLTDPACPKPGEMLSISDLYGFVLTPSEGNYYILQIPLNEPVEVNGPYFVGAYFAPMGDPTAAAVLTDDISVPCVSYNDWGEGYADLDTVRNDLGELVFPGRLILYSSGTTGGNSGTEPLPAAVFVNPMGNQKLGTEIDLWAGDASGSTILDQAEFQYYNGSLWLTIGFDANSEQPLRNGVTPSGSGDGFSYLWNTSGLSEGDYPIRVILYDTLGRSDTTEITVSIDPTPLTPTLTSPVFGENICGGVTAQITSIGENISYVTLDSKNASRNFSLPVTIFDQQWGGDANDIPEDGNAASSGEFGDYCSAPAAAAMAIKYWFDTDSRYVYLLREGSSILTNFQLMDRLFSSMRIEENLGAYDADVVNGMREYFSAHGNQIIVYIDRKPSVSALRNWMQNSEHAVIVGISGDPGSWMTITGATGLQDDDGYYNFSMANPITAAIENYQIRQDPDNTIWINYEFSWRRIDIALGLIPYDWTVSRTSIGIDWLGTDGWELFWNTSSLNEDSLYFLHVTVHDQADNTASTALLTVLDCNANFLPGDVNNDGALDPADMVYLTNYLFANGPAPPIGDAAADINCDGTVNLADVISLYKYMFLAGPAPCN